MRMQAPEGSLGRIPDPMVMALAANVAMHHSVVDPVVATLVMVVIHRG